MDMGATQFLEDEICGTNDTGAERACKCRELLSESDSLNISAHEPRSVSAKHI
jgi:hypothetical protein